MRNSFAMMIRTLHASLVYIAVTLTSIAVGPAYGAVECAALGIGAKIDRLSKAALLAERGKPEGFLQLQESRDALTQQFKTFQATGICKDGGSASGDSLVNGKCDAAQNVWSNINLAATRILDRQETLRTVTAAIQQVNEAEKSLVDLTEQIITLKVVNSRSSREIIASSQLLFLQSRLVKNATMLLVTDSLDPEIVFLLGKDRNSFTDLLRGLLDGSDKFRLLPSKGIERDKLIQLSKQFEADKNAVTTILSNLKQLIEFKQSVQYIVAFSEKLSQRLHDLESIEASECRPAKDEQNKGG